MIAVLGISAGSIYAVMGGVTLQSFGTPSPASGTYMTGHVDVVVRDQGGNIVAYRQADNAIVAHGMAIIIDQVFNNATGADAGAVGSNHANTTNVLSEAPYTKVGWMSIGNSSTTPAWTDTNLGCALETAGSCGGINRGTCLRVLSDIDNQTATGVGAGPNAQINVTAIATFAGVDCFSNTIQEAGIWNHPTGNPVSGNMFARNIFGSVTLTTTDSLELTWKFTFTDQ